MYILETWTIIDRVDDICNNWLIHFDDEPYGEKSNNTFWMTDIGRGERAILPTYWVSLRQLVKDLKKQIGSQKVIEKKRMLIIQETTFRKLVYVIRKLEKRK